MNIYLFIIVGIIIFEYLLSFAVKFLNIKALDPALPKEFEDTFDQEKYSKSQNYTKTNTKFSFMGRNFLRCAYAAEIPGAQWKKNVF